MRPAFRSSRMFSGGWTIRSHWPGQHVGNVSFYRFLHFGQCWLVRKEISWTGTTTCMPSSVGDNSRMFWVRARRKSIRRHGSGHRNVVGVYNVSHVGLRWLVKRDKIEEGAMTSLPSSMEDHEGCQNAAGSYSRISQNRNVDFHVSGVFRGFRRRQGDQASFWKSP